MKKLTFILLAALYFLPSGTAQNRDLRFDTKAAMYAANEEWLTFACEVPEGMVELGLEHQSDMYFYSLYNLSNLELQSGLGVHMVSSPLLKKHAKEDKGMPWSKGMMLPMRQRKFMLNSVAQFKAKSGAAQLDNPVFGGYGPPRRIPRLSGVRRWLTYFRERPQHGRLRNAALGQKVLRQDHEPRRLGPGHDERNPLGQGLFP